MELASLNIQADSPEIELGFHEGDVEQRAEAYIVYEVLFSIGF